MKKIKQQGFTLIEMITVLGIFMVMTSIVLFNYNKFTGDTILTNMAYEVALSVREAQIYGVSVRNPNGTIGSAAFGKPYGISFVGTLTGGSSMYSLFADLDNNNQYGGGATCVAGAGECVTPYTLQRNVKITSVMTSDTCTSSNLSIVFKRPDPEPIMNGSSNIDFAEIELTSPTGSKRYVIIRNNGQIYVTNTSECLPDA